MSFAVVHDLLSGIENAPSGDAWFYLPNSLTLIPIFGDDTGTATTNPVTLDSNGRGTVYLSQQARMVVQTAAGVTVVDTVINKELDSLVSVDSDAFTGDTLGDVLDAAQTAFGGQDFKYKPAIGAIAGMTPKDWMSGVWRNVMAYAASTAPTINDGVTPADTAIAAAAAAVVAAGGGVVYFPPGTYLINAPIALTGATGVSFRGASRGSSTIKNNSGSGNTFTLTTCTTFSIESLQITSTAGSTGTGVALSACSTVRLFDLTIISHQIGIDVAGPSPSVSAVVSCGIVATTNAASRAIRYTTSGAGSSFHRIYDCVLSGSTSGKCVEYTGTVSECLVVGSNFSSNCPVGILFNASLTGTKFVVQSSPSLSAVATPFDLTGLATDPIFRQFGNEIDGTVISQAIPNTYAVNRALGEEFHLRATSGGAATGTVSAPTPVPTAAMRKTLLTLRLTNASAGAVTWALNAAFVLVGGAAPSGTDGTTVTVVFRWDVQTSKWREDYRGQTTT